MNASGTSCGCGAKRRLVEPRDRPRDADRAHLRMRGEPAIEVAAAVAEAMARFRCSRRTARGPRRARPARRRWTAVPHSSTMRRRTAVPATVFERRAGRVAQKATRAQVFRAPSRRRRAAAALNSRAMGPVAAEALGLERRDRARAARPQAASAVGKPRARRRSASRCRRASGAASPRSCEAGTRSVGRVSMDANGRGSERSERTQYMGAWRGAAAARRCVAAHARARWRRAACRRGAGRRFATIARRARALRRKDRDRLAAPRARRPRPSSNPLAMWVDYWELTNRLSEVAAGRVRRLRAALARHLRRGSPAQRLAARARPPARLGELRRRVPALSHERRPRGHVLRAAGRPRSPARTCAKPALAAWLAQRDADDGCALHGRDAGRRRAAERRPTSGARRAPAIEAGGRARRARPRAARRAAAAARRSARSSTARRATSRASASASDARRRRADDAGADAHGGERPGCGGAAARPIAGSARCRADLAAWAWASVARQTALKLQPEAADQLPARRDASAAKSGARARALATTRWPGRRAPRCAPTTARPRWQQVVQAIDAMSAGRAARPGMGLLEGARAAGAGARFAGRRSAARA